MEIQVRSLKTAKGETWQVSLGRNSVTFRSEAEARDFVRTLEARLHAPHPLPRRDQHVA
ncbi:hypothetical protein [Pseudomonas sp. PIC25]|uniref:hypothetical protein n=1 Tax=Pseudomonas sp. PIC25 TaxID=1958773 RepID=UPI00143D3788|nr:hypothetical protein [Pseudomonas sp. PIC25]